MNRTSFRVPVNQPGSSMPQYNPQQLPATPGAGVSARLSDSAAQVYSQGTDQQARQIDVLGRGMQQIAKAGYDLHTDYQTGKAREAFNQLRAEEMDIKARLAGITGKDAIDPENGVQASIAKWQQDARARLTKDLGGMARSLFDQAAELHLANLTAWGIEKHTGEERTYLNQQDEGTIALDAYAMLSDPLNTAAVKNGFGNIKGRYRALRDRNGWSDEITQAKLNAQAEKIFSKMVDSQIDGDNLGAARELLGRYGEYMGGSRSALEARITAKGRELQARARAEQEMRFVSTFATDPLQGIAEISTPEGQAKYGLDAKAALGVRSMLQAQWSFNKQAEKERRDAYTTNAVNGIYATLTGDPSKKIPPDPAKAYQDLQNSNLDALTKLEMGRKLEDGTIGKTRDAAAVNDMARLIVSGEVDSDAPIDVMLAQGKASVGDVAMLKGMRKDMDGPLKDYLKRGDALVGNAFARPQFAAGTPEAAIKEDRARNQLQRAITEAYKKGGPEAVEKLFSSDLPMSIMSSNAVSVDDELNNLDRVLNVGRTDKRPIESADDYVNRRTKGAAQ